MWQFFTMGNLSSCPAPTGRCTCESQLYATTGTMALIAGIMQWVVGYNYSMAALSDALHALSDAAADFLGMFIAKKVKYDVNEFRTKELRSVGNKAISALLTIGATIIGFEAYDRWSSGNYLVWLPAVVVVGIFGLVIDLIRFRMLSKARGHSNNSNLEGLVEHARSDAWHSGIISAIAIIAILGSLAGFNGGLYEFFVRLTDYLASLGLAGYMMFILAPRIWVGKGCGHKHAKTGHKHSDKCNHH